MRSVTYRYIPILILFAAILIFILSQILKINFIHNIKLDIATIQGDREALNGIDIVGNIVDSKHRLEFDIKDGEISKRLFKIENLNEYEKFLEDKSYFYVDNMNILDKIYSLTHFTVHKDANIKKESVSSNYYKIDRVQPIISIDKSEDNSVSNIFFIPNCYIYSDSFDFKIQEREHINSENNTKFISPYSSNSIYSTIDYKRYITEIDGDIYFTVITDNKFRGNSGIYRVDNFYQSELDDYINAKEKGDLNKVKIIDKNIDSNFKKLADIDLEDGNRCVYSMVAMDNKLAVIVYEFKTDNMIEYQLWLFDPDSEKFLFKIPITESEQLNLKTEIIDNSGRTTYIQNYCNIDVFVQDDYMNLAFESRSKDFSVFTFKFDSESISLINNIDSSSSYIGDIQNVFYKAGKTYIQFKDMSHEVPVLSEKAVKWMEFSRTNMVPSALFSNSIVEIFDGSQKIYSGQIITDIEQDVIDMFNTNDDNIRHISSLEFR